MLEVAEIIRLHGGRMAIWKLAEFGSETGSAGYLRLRTPCWEVRLVPVFRQEQRSSRITPAAAAVARSVTGRGPNAGFEAARSARRVHKHRALARQKLRPRTRSEEALACWCRCRRRVAAASVISGRAPRYSGVLHLDARHCCYFTCVHIWSLQAASHPAIDLVGPNINSGSRPELSIIFRAKFWPA